MTSAWQPPRFEPGRLDPGLEVRRPCGCFLDPAVGCGKPGCLVCYGDGERGVTW